MSLHTNTGGGHVPRTGRRPVVWLGTYRNLRKHPDPERDVLLNPPRIGGSVRWCSCNSGHFYHRNANYWQPQAYIKSKTVSSAACLPMARVEKQLMQKFE